MQKFGKRPLRKTSPKGNKLKRIIFLVILLILIVVLVKFSKEFLIVKSLKLYSDNLVCVTPEELKQTLSLKIKNSVFYDQNRIEKEIKEKYYCIAGLTIKREGIGKLLIDIKQRQPIAKIVLAEERNLDALMELTEATASSQAAALTSPDFSVPQAVDNIFLADNKGVIISKDTHNLNLPLIYFVGDELKLGQVVVDGKLDQVVDLINKIKGLNLNIKSVKVDGDKILIDSTPELVFGLNNDLKIQFASLQLILQKAKMNSGEGISATDQKKGQIEMINLRFDKPVVRYKR